MKPMTVRELIQALMDGGPERLDWPIVFDDGSPCLGVGDSGDERVQIGNSLPGLLPGEMH